MIDKHKIIDGGIWIPLEEIEKNENEQLDFSLKSQLETSVWRHTGKFEVFNEMHRLIEQDTCSK